MGVELREFVKIKNFDKLAGKLSAKLADNSRYHICEEKLDKLSWPDPVHDQGICDFKPLGMWYGFGDSWLRFLEEEAEYYAWALHRIDRARFIYRLRLDTRKILRLDGKRDFNSFTYKYGMALPSRGPKHNLLIDWEQVSKVYSGIEIRGCESWMNEYLWYDGWSCASGCLWSGNGLRGIEVAYEF